MNFSKRVRPTHSFNPNVKFSNPNFLDFGEIKKTSEAIIQNFVTKMNRDGNPER